MKLILKTRPEFCGPVTIGTVSLIVAVRDALGIRLKDAKLLVEQSIDDEHGVELHPPSEEAAKQLIAAAKRAQAPTEIKLVD